MTESHAKFKNNAMLCNLCGSEQFSHLFDETPMPMYTFSVARCETCGLISTQPLPDDEFLVKLYSSESYRVNTVSGTYCLDEHISSVDFAFVLRRLRSLVNGTKLLDIGCGAGTFVSATLQAGWDSYGIEPSLYASKIAGANLRDRIYAGFLHSVEFAEASFDAITLWYVLEHVPNPTNILSHSYTLLRDGGLLFIAVPNAHYIFLRRKLAQIKTGVPGTVHAHEHLYQYTSKTLKSFLRKTGFEFISEHSASPYMVSGPMLNIAKRFGKLAVSTLFMTTGINLGGILMFGRKNVSDHRGLPHRPH